MVAVNQVLAFTIICGLLCVASLQFALQRSWSQCFTTAILNTTQDLTVVGTPKALAPLTDSRSLPSSPSDSRPSRGLYAHGHHPFNRTYSVLHMHMTRDYFQAQQKFNGSKSEAVCQLSERFFGCVKLLANSSISCLDSKAAKGICQKGETLCLLDTATVANNVRGFPVGKPDEVVKRGWCSWGGSSYVCMDVDASCTGDCLAEHASMGICRAGLLCPAESYCKDRRDGRCFPPAEAIVSPRCIGSRCLVQNVMYKPAWTSAAAPCGSHDCFGCMAVWHAPSSTWRCELETRAGMPRANVSTQKKASASPPTLPGSKCALDKVLHKNKKLLVPVLTSSPGRCTTKVNRTAVLGFVEGWNLFHQLLVTFRRLFVAVNDFSSHDQPVSDCVLILMRKSDGVGAGLGGFGDQLLPLLCDGGLMSLSTDQTTCFQRLILGANPGGWDMEIQRVKPVATDWSGLEMMRVVKRRFGLPLTVPGKPQPAVLLYIRRGRRELVNEAEVVRALNCSSTRQPSPCSYVLTVTRFETLSLKATVSLLSTSLVLAGVHGAGLTNLIFLPPGGAVVEMMIGTPRAAYEQLSRSFSKMYFQYDATALHAPRPRIHDERDMQVEVLDLGALAGMVADAVDLAAARAQVVMW